MRTGAEYKYSCEHADISSIPKQFKDMERVAFTRHPATWYESWYSYTKMRFNSEKFKSTSVWEFVLSNGFTSDIDTFISNALNIKKFLLMGGLSILKSRIQHIMMNHYICRYASYWDDVSLLSPEMFDCSLYDWYIRTLGIDTATTFRFETQLEEGLSYISPTAILKKQNACPSKERLNKESVVMVSDTDWQYIKRFGYI